RPPDPDWPPTPPAAPPWAAPPPALDPDSESLPQPSGRRPRPDSSNIAACFRIFMPPGNVCSLKGDRDRRNHARGDASMSRIGASRLDAAAVTMAGASLFACGSGDSGSQAGQRPATGGTSSSAGGSGGTLIVGSGGSGNTVGAGGSGNQGAYVLPPGYTKT